MGIIPAHNEVSTIGDVIAGLRDYVDRILVVDDGSDDDTASSARRAGASVLSHQRNLGGGAALMSGYAYAIREGAEVIVQIDGDGQHDPEYIPEMLSKIETGSDLVVGSRYLDPFNAEEIRWRDSGIRFYSRMLSLLLSNAVTDATSGFRLARTQSLMRMEPLPPRHWAICQTFDFIRAGLRYGEISVRMLPRMKGDSQFSAQAAAMYHLRVGRALAPRLVMSAAPPRSRWWDEASDQRRNAP